MDDFVCNKLKEWGLSELMEKIRDEGIDKEVLYSLEDNDIKELIPKMGQRIKFKNRLKELKVFPSTSDTGKRKMDLQGESKSESTSKRPRVSTSLSESLILSEVKEIMGDVHQRLCSQTETKLNTFVKSKITGLEIEKRELVGVFGKTGAGKSSLINAVIGQKNLLPSGSVNACTSVMIKVEANVHNPNYEADIEFITKEEWQDELWSMSQCLGNTEVHEQEDDDYQEIVEKLSALYGDEWKTKSPESRVENKYFKEIPEFLQSRKKTLTYESAKELSDRIVMYTRNDTQQGEGTAIKRWYWPLVKCVTVKVPQNDLLQHVTLVDLPGNGDRNKSRDQMWKGIVGNCSTVWIVTEINRAASEQESWEILKSAASLLGNGGQCRHIHFICTKSDHTGDTDDHSVKAIRAEIQKRNKEAKMAVNKEFNKLRKIKKHFSDDCFEVFTVSSKEFFKGKLLSQEATEIPKLQEFLKDLNDCHSETLNYVSGAHGILSLIQGASRGQAAGNSTEVSEYIERNVNLQLTLVKKAMERSYSAFHKSLQEGVEKSKSSCEKTLKYSLYPPKKTGSACYRMLRSLVNNGGIYKPKKGKQQNLNMKLASFLTDSIDEEFRNTFPNDNKCGAFNGAINKVSLDIEGLIQKYRHTELQLIFLKTEEEKLKINVRNLIRDLKRAVYSSLTDTIENNMQQCYKRAAEFRGTGSLQNMRETIQRHVLNLKSSMFNEAKNVMLNLLHSLMVNILHTMWITMKESIELSLKTEERLIPDVSTELLMVNELYSKLKSSSQMETL